MLQRLYGAVTITETIRAEACDPRAPERLRTWLSTEPPWLVIADNPFPLLDETCELDDGEATAITLAWQHRNSCLLLIDERRGRTVCAALGLPMTGAAGLLTDAAAAGWIDFEDVFKRLSKTHFRLAETVVDTLRRRLREQSDGGR